MVDLEPPRLATSTDDVLEAHLYNMERLGVCYSKYDALREAVDARKED